MAKATRTFTCQTCGSSFQQWSGKCDGCGEWNTMVEERKRPPGQGKKSVSENLTPISLEPLNGPSETHSRITLADRELNRVTGGGLVPGSVALIGGEPGIGKSTLLMQTAADIAASGREVVYVSGEESLEQLRLRAVRLNLKEPTVRIATGGCVEDILSSLTTPVDFLIIDSIQTSWSSTFDAAPGTVGQIRAASQGLIRFAKESGACIILVGHVTKDGQIAGPRVLEHMVDVVLYFEGDSRLDFRLLRAVKNRYGPTDEVGVFQMTTTGLHPVNNPSELLIDRRGTGAPGSAVFATLEGSRAILAEVQTLVAHSHLSTPRRAVVGWDPHRLAMILAVLETRCKINLTSKDVYLNVAGGLKVRDPAIDVAVAAALVSSAKNNALPVDGVYFGELSLSGALRPVRRTEARLREISNLGFSHATFPAGSDSTPRHVLKGITCHQIENLSDLVATIA